MDDTNKHEAFMAHLERARVIVSQWPAWKREILGNKQREPAMETNLTKEYLDRITRSCGGTVAKPATPNTRSDAASANEMATAVAGAGPDVPAWKAACRIEPAEQGGWNVHSPTRSHYLALGGWHAYTVIPSYGRSLGSFTEKGQAQERLAAMTTCPPDWPTAAHADDPREEPEPFCEATGPMPEPVQTVRDWKAACRIKKHPKSAVGWVCIYSPSGLYVFSREAQKWLDPNPSDYKQGPIFYHDQEFAEEVLDECQVCPPDWTDTTTRTDPSPCGTYARKITKPCESIERLVDRLATVNGSIEVSHGMSFRVTGNIEKAEPRSYDTPGYPAHFSLHHVYMPEDWTRGVLMSIAYGLDGKLDKGTIRTVLEQVSRSLVLTGEMDEADLLGLAVAVEDKLDIGK